MTTTFELHRINICGPIKDDTPACVIFEVAHCLRLQIDWDKINVPQYVDNVLRSISGIKVNTVTENAYKAPAEHGFPLDPELLSFMASFVNPNDRVNWKHKPLIRAFRHLCRFYKVTTPPQLESKFVIGDKTMDQPEAYNACMLYRLCTYHGIRTWRQMTIEQMGHAMRDYYQDPAPLRERLIAAIGSLPHAKLINLSMSPDLRVAPSPSIRHPHARDQPITVESLPLPSIATETESGEEKKVKKSTFPNINPENTSTKALVDAYTRVVDLKHILSRVQPISQDEAIMMGAVVCGVNLTECSNPYEEYMALKDASLNGTDENRYIPTYDEVFQKRYLRNVAWFDVRQTWCPRLSSIYTPDQLTQFALAEGYTQTEVKGQDIVQLLAMARVMPTFYLGRHPDCTQDDTNVGGIEVCTINPQLLITYGIADGGPYALYTIGELCDCWLNTRSYSNPQNVRELISKTALEKLRNIARERVRPKEGQPPRMGRTSIVMLNEVEAGYRRLLDVMEEVDSYAIATSEKAKQLNRYYAHGDEKQKDAIVLCLTNLLHMAYYMRGWKVNGNDEIPIGRDKTQFPNELQGQVDMLSTESIMKFEKDINRLPFEVRQFFRTLPLMKIATQGTEIKFEAAAGADEGKTVIDRIAIVKAGTSVFSCIRMSSNWFAASAYYYMVAIGLPAPFLPRQLASIT
ncbi:Hypothetical protein POVN_LOCUS236 [uncultured virus]|nr:Hypothetical protein POVN_LOCUS236 [uncultured virus]